MSLIDMAQLDWVQLYSGPDSPTRGRDEACAAVEGELASRCRHPDETTVALRSYGTGCVALGIAGPVDRATARRLGTLLRGLRPFSTRELLVTFTLLGPWDPQLARVVGQVRVHHLIDGGRLVLHGAPAALYTAVGAPPPDSAPPPDGTAAHPPRPEDREP